MPPFELQFGTPPAPPAVSCGGSTCTAAQEGALCKKGLPGASDRDNRCCNGNWRMAPSLGSPAPKCYVWKRVPFLSTKMDPTEGTVTLCRFPWVVCTMLTSLEPLHLRPCGMPSRIMSIVCWSTATSCRQGPSWSTSQKTRRLLREQGLNFSMLIADACSICCTRGNRISPPLCSLGLRRNQPLQPLLLCRQV